MTYRCSCISCGHEYTGIDADPFATVVEDNDEFHSKLVWLEIQKMDKKEEDGGQQNQEA